MSELKQIICEKLMCFECKGDLGLIGDTLYCKKCSNKYNLNKNLISYYDFKFKTQYGEQFGKQAQNYEQYHSLNEDFSKGIAWVIKKALERFTTLPVYCALELGCGTGILTRGCNFHGIARYFLATDISKEMLDEAAKKDSTDNVMYLVQNACELNIKDSSFDIVVGSAFLHHLTYIKSGLEEVFRVLGHNGLAVFMEPFYYGNLFVTFLMKIVIESIKLQRKYSKNFLQTLEETIDIYSNGLRFRFENRKIPEKLAMFDDKHLFIQKDIKLLAKEVGFSNVEVVSPWHLNPISKSMIWKEITIEVIEKLIREVNLDKQKIDYSKVPIINIVDDLIGDELLEHIPPQGVMIFQK